MGIGVLHCRLSLMGIMWTSCGGNKVDFVWWEYGGLCVAGIRWTFCGGNNVDFMWW